MEDNFVNNVIDLYKEKKWKEIINKYHNHSDRNKLLWVFPSEENLAFIKKNMELVNCDRILSIGCGSGLLEWIITEATDLPVAGVEVEGTWWHCKYAPPTFIPLLITTTKLNQDLIKILQNSKSTALLFCYFNNREAFEEYLKYFSGNVLIIIGPDGKGVHTDPKAFGDIGEEWTLLQWQEVRSSRDYVAVYYKNDNSIPLKH